MWKIEHRAYRLPFRVGVRTAHGLWGEREGFLIRVSCAQSAAQGWGEAAPIPWFGTESVAIAGAALEGLRGATVDLSDALARVPLDCGATRAGLAAAWAMATEVVGGGAEATEPKAKFLAVAGLLPAGRAALDAVGPALELGYRVFKWKVGVGPAVDELALLDDLLGCLPAGAKLRLDANGAWDRRVAERWLAGAAERPVEYVEQPVAADARGVVDLLRGLAADYPVTLALDESLGGAGDIERWLAVGWPGVWVIKPALLAEPEALLARLAVAGADLVFGSALETRVGVRAGLRLAFGDAERRAAAGGRARALGYGVWPLFADVRADGPATGAFVRREDVARINVEELWNALG
jgi:O-succinylbenzoate synthase